MKRRHFALGIAAVPAVPAALAQQPGPPSRGGSGGPPTGGDEGTPRLQAAVADDAADTVTRFFNPDQFAALRRLSDILMPQSGDVPGALSAGAPEFLDFLLSQSPAAEQWVYLDGLDALNAQAQARFSKSFAEVDARQAEELLEPLRRPWTPEPPSDPLAAFLVQAKADVRTATTNSREWSAANPSGGRRGGGMGLYWYPID